MWKCFPCFAKTYEAPEVLELDYRHSSLAEVPADVFSFERTLEKLDLGSNQISDLPPSLFHCHELKELDLCDNDLTSIPPAVGSLTRLCKLDLSRNAITDISDSIKNCKSLVYFDLSMNHLTKLPEGISQLVNLEELFLNDTYLEFLHANFGRLAKLKVLELRENSLQTLPKSMSRLHNLQRLDIGQNDIQELPEVIGTMSNLTELWCDNNSIRSLPKFMGNLSKLSCLDVSHNEVQSVAEEISKCVQMSDLTLNINSIDVLPDSFTKLENLSVLRLDSNGLSYLPQEFGNLRNLQELSIVGNNLKALPGSIGLMRKLHTMYLDDNLLSALPKEIGSCTSLSVLSMAKNRLKEIPSEVGHLSNLKVFTLSGNQLVHLPVSILNIPNLGALWLSESQSKPLLQLNKEMDSVTGQLVLTCYLLPQLPSNAVTNKKSEAKDAGVSRRTRPSIKFVTDLEPVMMEPTVGKRGLLRAPTPYPKELRALAKHASHIRQKDHNGEIANTDEPMYEGDYPEDLHQPVNPLQGRQHSSAGTSHSSYSSNLLVPGLASKVEYKAPILVGATETIGLPAVSTTSAGKTYTISASYSSASVTGSTTGVSETDRTSSEGYGSSSSELSKKTPPPYHVAARRAAFFRSSGGAGSDKLGASTPGSPGHARASPIIGRLFPLPVDVIPYSSSVASSSSVISSTISTPNPADTQKVTMISSESEGYEDQQKDSNLNLTYTVSTAGDENDNESDIVSSVEEHLDVVSSLDVAKGTLDSKNLVKTIESALESVDKRTTEFLRDNRWEDEQEGQETCSTSSQGHVYSNVDEEKACEDQTLAKPSTEVPNWQSVESVPVVPPKPSAITSASRDSPLDRPPSSSSYSSFRSESSSKIPTFTSPLSGKAYSSPPSSLFCSDSTAKPATSRAAPEVSSHSSITSRIPKLPSLTTAFQVHSRSNGQLPERSPMKKPEILTPKPVVTRTGTPTRISSLGASSADHGKDKGDSIITSTSSSIPSTTAIKAPTNPSSASYSAKNVNSNINTSLSTSRIPRIGDTNEKQELKQIETGDRIPIADELDSRTSTQITTVDNVEFLPENNNDGDKHTAFPPMTRIPSLGKKPWIFGTHRNARVVALEYKKVNALGFTVSDTPASGALDGRGIYIVETDSPDSTVKINDKILQIDGIDVSNMGLEIVKKILSNCQDNINLLVSRHN